ncbi:MAG: hypothetical protein IID44_10725 [Planctomycetes bacterium]|nr:hypothetical protein [Planctomycetota bacterium]
MNGATIITEQQRQALHEQQGRPVPARDEQTQGNYFIVEEDLHRRAMRALQEKEDVAAIQAGVDAAADGRVSTLEEVDARIREKLGLPPRP